MCKTILLIGVLLVTSTLAEAKIKCIATYEPNAAIIKNDPPCREDRDMGYIDNSENPFTDFHFLSTVPQDKRDYYSLHMRLSLPWHISNPKIGDDK